MIKKENFVKSETYCPCFDGFYETLLSTLADDFEEEHYLFNDYESVDDKYKNFISENIYKVSNYKLIFEDISKKVVDFFNDYFKSEKLQIKFKWQSLVSPKEYNFRTDSINIKALYTTDFIIFLNDYVCNNMKEFDKWIKERYTSHDGFISSWSNNYQVWLGYLNKECLQKEEHFLGTFLEFYFENEVGDKITEDIYYYCHEYFYSNGHIFDNKYCDYDKLIELINKEFNLNIESLKDLENM